VDALQTDFASKLVGAGGRPAARETCPGRAHHPPTSPQLTAAAKVVRSGVARVVLTNPLPIDLRPLLPRHDLVGGAAAMSRVQLLDAVRDADAIICLLGDRIDDELLARAPK